MTVKRKRVLVVDDDAGVRSVIRASVDALLAEAGIRLEEEGTASAAYDRVAQGERDAWFIVTDNRMPSVGGQPVRDGKDLICRIRRRAVRAHIIFMSGSEHRREDVSSIGADRCLVKPFVFAPILEDLRRFLSTD
ncbi:response regulator [Candidatus Uhrbacteria bacterium]|nr:response regulator [Candidatus Uhrbacteria bacterium]